MFIEEVASSETLSSAKQVEALNKKSFRFSNAFKIPAYVN